jgi:hypothetical protein
MIISISGGPDEERDDYRPVPESDRDSIYGDRGMLGGYCPSEQPFSPPDDVRFEAGYGADVEDLKRGYCKPLVTRNPAYQMENYKDRASLPSVPGDVGQGNQEAMESDFEFRNRNRRSKGFLVRPHIARDRG